MSLNLSKVSPISTGSASTNSSGVMTRALRILTGAIVVAAATGINTDSMSPYDPAEEDKTGWSQTCPGGMFYGTPTQFALWTKQDIDVAKQKAGSLHTSPAKES